MISVGDLGICKDVAPLVIIAAWMVSQSFKGEEPAELFVLVRVDNHSKAHLSSCSSRLLPLAPHFAVTLQRSIVALAFR